MTRWSSLIALCFVQAFVVYDFQVGELLIKPLVLDFGAGHMQILNFETNYLLMFACFSIVASYFGLAFGWKKVLRVGILLFLVSQSLIYFATKIEMILVARLLSGLGAACAVPSVLSLAMAFYKKLGERALIFGIFGSVFAYFRFEAPLFADYLLNEYGIKGTYLFIIFLGVTSYVLSFMIQKTEQNKISFVMDTKGMVLIVLFIFTFLFGLSRASIWGVILASSSAPIRVFWFMSPAFFIVSMSKFFFIYFLKHEVVFEKEHGFALMPTSLFKNSMVLISLIQVGIVFAFLASPMSLLLEYLKQAMELSTRIISGVVLVYVIAAILFFMAMPLFILRMFKARSIFTFATIMGTIGSFFVFYSIGVDSFNARVLYIGLILFAFHNASILVLACLLIVSNLGQRDAEQSAGTIIAYKHILGTFASATTALILSLIIGITFRVSLQDTKMSAQAQAHFKEFTFVKALTSLNEFLSDGKVEQEAEELGFSEKDTNAYVEANQEFRAYSVAKAVIFMGLLFLLNLLFAKKIPQEVLLSRKKQ